VIHQVRLHSILFNNLNTLCILIITLKPQRCFNVETTTSEKLSKSNINSTLKQRCDNVKTTTLLQRYVTMLFQRRFYDVGKTFKIHYKFNVETTLRHDVVTTLLQRQCVYWAVNAMNVGWG
jgi:hypothetical protein